MQMLDIGRPPGQTFAQTPARPASPEWMQLKSINLEQRIDPGRWHSGQTHQMQAACTRIRSIIQTLLIIRDYIDHEECIDHLGMNHAPSTGCHWKRQLRRATKFILRSIRFRFFLKIVLKNTARKSVYPLCLIQKLLTEISRLSRRFGTCVYLLQAPPAPLLRLKSKHLLPDKK